MTQNSRSRAPRARTSRPPRAASSPGADLVPRDVPVAVVEIGDRRVQLTNLQKPFWPDLGLTKGDLLRYYAEVADVLLPHLRDRPMVMKRWPNGVTGTFFFMKRVPKPYPPWLRTQTVEHKSGSTIDFPLVQDLPSLLWTVNLGCIDLNPWGALADDPNRPDVVYFDLDPGPEAPFDRVREVALVIRDALATLALPNVVKTSGSRGIHVAVPITRGPVARKVWEFAQAVARELAARHPKIATADFRLATRPRDRVLIDYNRNSWGQTQASVYSVRPHPRAAVSTPVTWQEVERGFAIDDFRIDNVPSRVKKRGDLWAPLLRERGRADLGRFV